MASRSCTKIQDKPPVWKARYRDNQRTAQHPYGKEHSRRFGTQKEANRWLDDETAKLVTGTWVDPRKGKMSFREFAEMWRAAQTHGDNTRDKTEIRLRCHVYPVLGDRELGKISEFDASDWFNGIKQAESTKNIILGTVKSIFRLAVKQGFIAVSPVEELKAPSRDSIEDMWLPDARAVVAMREALPGPYKASVELAGAVGLRQAEILGLEVGDIDFDEKVVKVRRQRSEQPAPIHFGFPKTATSRRDVPVTDRTLKVLEQHIDTYAKLVQVPDFTDRKYKLGATAEEVTRESNLLFPLLPEYRLNPQYRLISNAEWWRIWTPAKQAAGWPTTNRTGIHSLRHRYASALIRWGESVPTICKRMGHANPQVTLRVYSHMWDDNLKRTREAIDAMQDELDLV